ncbi:hypothetical protein [Micromonospora sp. NPDC051296]|uniref:hypothetical protein n=1 Tax=Micromonospora sp. NPDC051296 TaxID=3155046 RepID=UPI003434EE9B
MLRIAVFATALLVALAACASDHQRPTAEPASAPPSPSLPSQSPTSGKHQILEGDGFRTLVAATEVHFLAAIGGQLAVGDGGCLIVQGTGEQGYVVVWPPEVTLLTDGRAGVQLPEAGAITVGDRFSGSGGYFDTPLAEDQTPGLYPPIPSECAGGGTTVALFGSVSTG